MGGSRRPRRAVAGLPAEVSSFVGRRQELSAARRRLSESRLLTLAGPGGVGKTRLALRVAADAHRAFRDGAQFVQLDELRDPALLASTIAAAFGPAPAGLVDSLRDKHLLLVLDNCEHLLEACGLLAGELLRGCPHVRILATSREPLGIEGESLLPVAPLPAPDPGEPSPPALLSRYAAVELFVDRAAAADPGFRLTEDNQRVVAEICATLDGIPLAIELAAVRLRTLTLHEILDHLADRFALLTQGNRAAATRQQTLRACIGWSFDLCSEPERLLWARLSVFAGSFALDAAAGVCGEEPARMQELLSALAEKSVLAREVHNGRTRYRLLDSMRLFGRQQLDDHGDIAARHLEWYARLTRQAEAEWFTASQVSWMHRLTAEHANLRAALEHGLAEPSLTPAAAQMAVQLGEYWFARGRLADGQHWLGGLISATADPALRVRLLCVHSRMQATQGRPDAALQQIAAARQLADATLRPEVDIAAGFVATFTGDAAGTIAPLEALARSTEPGRPNQILVLGLLSAIKFATGDTEDAARHARACLARTEETGERWMRATVLGWLGLLAWQKGDLPRARELHRMRLKVSLDLDDVLTTALSIEALAWVAATDGRGEHAAYLLGGAAAQWRTAATQASAMPLTASFHQDCEKALARQLGSAGYRIAFERGATAPVEDVVEAALEDRGGSTKKAPAPDPDAPALTRREAEVARLIAYGMSDRQISEKLMISRRTAEWHVERILRKLDFSSRTQVAAWWSAESVAGEAARTGP
ncbi:ATP-binding protein [Amycolatopsis jejuensis]|uniref:ATP-binding protein n=1 Tax=Amycolatopsis jejuensis TaxID=330084 RepID=UPI0007C50162|nr:LuxR C-terminal-related transcriptional regulator [Amycolatopsis jejuensis]